MGEGGEDGGAGVDGFPHAVRCTRTANQSHARVFNPKRLPHQGHLLTAMRRFGRFRVHSTPTQPPAVAGPNTKARHPSACAFHHKHGARTRMPIHGSVCGSDWSPAAAKWEAGGEKAGRLLGPVNRMAWSITPCTWAREVRVKEVVEGHAVGAQQIEARVFL